MSRRVVTEFEMEEHHQDLVTQVLDDVGMEYTEQDGQFCVTKMEGRYIGSKVIIDPSENEILHDNDPAPERVVQVFQQEFSKQKFHREAAIQGHQIQDEWVSDGQESHHLLQEADEGDVVIEASVSF